MNGEDIELNESLKEEFYKAHSDLGGKGERMIGFCDLRLDPIQYPRGHLFTNEELSSLSKFKNLRFLGFQAMVTKTISGIWDIVYKCHSIKLENKKLIKISGDHPTTVKAIARGVGLLRDSDKDELLLHGNELKLMSVKEIDDLLRNNKYKVIVFAHITPQQKLSIVDGCQRVGKIVNARDFNDDRNNDEAKPTQLPIANNQLSFFIFR